MNLLMISGDRSILQGKKGAFWYTLEEMSRHWERVDVICPRVDMRHETSDKSSHVSRLTSHVFPNVFFHPSPRGLWYQPRWIVQKGRELIAAHHHAVMTVHEFPPFYNGRGAIRLSRLTGIPFMLEVHHVVGYPRPASITEAIGRMWSRFRIPREARLAAIVRVVSHETESVLLRWGIPEEKIAQLPSAYLDFEALRPDPAIAKCYDLVSCARLVGNKGLEEMLQAVAVIPEVRFLLIGDGPLRSKLERLARDLNIANRVTFTGWLPAKEDVYGALQSAKIFLMNSKSEGGPRVTLEAMALGIPVISTSVGVIKQMQPEETGCALITTGTPEDLSQKIEQLLRDAPLRDSLSAKAMAPLRQQFDRRILVEGYAHALQNLASDTPSLL